MLWILIEVGVAMLAAFGFICAAKMLLELFLMPQQISVAIEIRDKKDADMLDMLLHEARSAFLRKGRAKLVVLLASDLMDGTVGEGDTLHDEYAELIDRFGAECYLIDPE